jgi:hypothetical protein
MIQLVRDLEAARALVASGWCQGESALDAAGDIVSMFDPAAAVFCASAACGRVASVVLHRNMTRRSEAMHAALLGVIRGDDLVVWNDHPKRTKRAVLAAFDRAIARARRGEGDGT